MGLVKMYADRALRTEIKYYSKFAGPKSHYTMEEGRKTLRYGKGGVKSKP